MRSVCSSYALACVHYGVIPKMGVAESAGLSQDGQVSVRNAETEQSIREVSPAIYPQGHCTEQIFVRTLLICVPPKGLIRLSPAFSTSLYFYFGT